MSNQAPPSRKRQHTRERLMDAAYQLFAHEGFHATSIEAIAEAAGFTRGAFYSNFDSKNELFFALAEREWSERLTTISAVLKRFQHSQQTETIPLFEQVSKLLHEIFSTPLDSRTWILISREFELQTLRDSDAAADYLMHEQALRVELKNILTSAIHYAGRKFVIDPLKIVEIILLVHESAVTKAMLRGEEDIESHALTSLLNVLPSLMEQLTETTPTSPSPDRKNQT